MKHSPHKIKLAIVYDAIYPYVKGGAEKRFYEIGKRLTKNGYEVHWYGMKLWRGKKVVRKEGIYLHGISKAMPLYTKNGKRSIWQAFYFGLSCLKLINEDFDVIDCCGFPYFSLFTCKLVCFFKKKKLNSTWHEVWGENYWKKYLGKLYIFGTLIEKMSIKLPDTIIIVSPQTENKIKTYLGFNKKIYMIPNGIDIEIINKIKQNKIKSDVIYSGRLMEFKHIDMLIKVIKNIKTEIPSISCIIIGDGPEKKKLINLTKNLNLQNNIKFTGFLKNHDEVYSYIKSSKVFVLPSTREGFGIVVLEANACGIPVVTINHISNAGKDLIKDKINGFLADFNQKALAEKILTAIKTGGNMKQKCINKARSYDWNQITGSLMEVYK